MSSTEKNRDTTPFGNSYAVNSIRIKHSQARIERQFTRRRSNTSIIIYGAISAGAIKLLDQISLEFFGTHSLEGWPLTIIGATLIIYAATEFIRRLLWQQDDTIYEREIKRLSDQ